MKSSPWTLALLLLACILPAAAQDSSSADWYYGKPITEIKFEGLVTVNRSDVEGVTKPFLGRKFSEEVFQDLQTALYATDYFDGLIVPTAQKANEQGTAVVLVFKVTEKPIVSEIQFQGNSKVRNADLQAALTIKTGDLANQAKVDSDVRALVQVYRDKGFEKAEVSATLVPLDAKKTKAVFTVTEGLQTAVKSIDFQGNVFASTATLKGLLSTKAQSLFDPGYFKEEALNRDLRAVETYYWNHGYLDARVIDVQRTPVFDQAAGRNMLPIVITVAEGEPLLFGGYSFEGNEIFPSSQLAALVRQPTGQTANKERIEADYRRIVDLYLENGYIFNTIDREEVREGRTLRYVVHIVEQPRAHIENIIVKGNTKTKSEVILREIPTEAGDVFSKTKIVQGIQNLYNLQYFGSVNPETPQGSADGLMNLVLNVEEGKTADVSFGLAFSGTSDFPVSAQVKWSDRNFLGNGQTLGLDSSFSPVNQTLNLTFNQNWLGRERISLGGFLGVTHAVSSKIDQDILGPTYDNDEIPDPYRSDDYVFTRTTTLGSDAGGFSGMSYTAGQTFPLVATAAQVAKYDLITRYQWDLNHGNVRKNAQMSYDSWQFNWGANTGYAWYTSVGRFTLSSGWKSTLQKVTYDSTIYRPANQSLRDNLDRWLLGNQWWTLGSWDTRDLIYNPSNGSLVSETVTFGGGFLLGNTHFTRSDTRLEQFFKVLSLPVDENYTFDLVFRAHTAFSLMGNALGGDGLFSVQPADQLYIDGMMSGRGWGFQSGGKASWTSGVELRTPVPYVGQLLWIDTFVDDALLIDATSDQSNPFVQPVGDHHFSVGTGIRIVSPQFPLALYFVKPFTLDSTGQVTWQAGDGLFGSSLDMKLVVSFGTQF